MSDEKLTLRQWMLDMTGPEDAWARDQYAALVQAAKQMYELHENDPMRHQCGEWLDLHKALEQAGEI